MSMTLVQKFNDKPFVPEFPNHTQTVESSRPIVQQGYREDSTNGPWADNSIF